MYEIRIERRLVTAYGKPRSYKRWSLKE
jgi:hypothetical protein